MEGKRGSLAIAPPVGQRFSRESLGDINPDFVNTPTMERHTEMTRERFIKLGETIHQLRAEIHQLRPTRPYDVPELRLRGEKIVIAVEEVRKNDEKFLIDTGNSNPGAGE